jgi:predicted RNA-binding protein YlxR (DUF448 family)
MRTKHVPQRTCVSCRTTDAKRTLVRLVRTPEGAVEVDPSGKRNGRGAYLCERAGCWEDALKRGRLAAALRTTIAPLQADELRAYAGRFETDTVSAALG